MVVLSKEVGVYVLESVATAADDLSRYQFTDSVDVIATSCAPSHELAPCTSGADGFAFTSTFTIARGPSQLGFCEA